MLKAKRIKKKFVSREEEQRDEGRIFHFPFYIHKKKKNTSHHKMKDIQFFFFGLIQNKKKRDGF